MKKKIKSITKIHFYHFKAILKTIVFLQNDLSK